MRWIILAALAGVCVLAGAGGQLEKDEAASMATCVGADPCRACSSCRYCGHCAKRGGTCGINKPRPATKPTR